nr:MAG TPA: hypothetical protein [Caudoviricetes sp.]
MEQVCAYLLHPISIAIIQLQQLGVKYLVCYKTRIGYFFCADGLKAM